MAPHAGSSGVSIRLTEPYLLLVGGPEHERARARRRRAARQATLNAATGEHDSATSDVQGHGTPIGSPSPSRPGSRPGSRAASPAPGSRGRTPGIHALGPTSAEFVPPPSRGRSGSRQRNLGGSRGRSSSRHPAISEEPVGLTTGTGTPDEALLADEPPPVMLRGLLTLTLSKPSRIREINVRLKGIARTEWPEGIGPRHMDTMEENVLTNITTSFFTASTDGMQRRAASIGPGSGDHGRSDSRGRSSRRAASMNPTRDMDISRGSGLRDGPSSTGHAADGSVYSVPLSTLSRIASSTDLDAMNTDPPPVQPGESAPAYEVVDSRTSSPARSRPGSAHGRPADSNDLTRALRHAPLQISRRLEGSPTPRSPLGQATQLNSSPGPTSDHNLPPLSRTSTSHSHLSQDTTSSSDAHLPATQEPSREVSTASSIASLGSTDNEAGNPWSSAPVLATAGATERGRPAARDASPVRNSAVEHTFQSRTSTRHSTPSGPTNPSSARQSSQGPGLVVNDGGRRRRSSSGSTTTTSIPTAPPSALRNTSASRGRSSSSRSGTSKTRFSLAGLSDALRGKSTSRVREPILPGRTSESTTRLGSEARDSSRARDRSPEAPTSRSRDRSRGRKTALKALREALTATAGSVHAEGGESDDEHGDERAAGWKEFRAGTYTYPISIAVPASLPPTISSDFGHVAYTLKATVFRAGALTSNLTTSQEVTLVSAPGQDDTEENESIVVERFWETQMKYHVALSGKSFPIGGTIPISVRLNPMAKVKLYRITAILEQKTNYYASNRKLTRHEIPKKYPLLRIEHKDPKEPLLPILSDDAEAIASHPLADFFINPTSADDTTPQLLDPLGPWNIESVLKLPSCSSRLNFSTAHDRANISIVHVLKIMLRVERGDDNFVDSRGKRKLWDVIIESPIHILSCHCTQNTLPAYSASTSSLTTSGTPPLHQCDPSSHSHSRLGINSSSSGSSSRHMGAFASASAQPHAAQATASGSGSGSGSGSSHHNAPPVATLAQNMLFARLVAGEETPAGEIPPTYETALTALTEPPGSSRSRSRLRRLSDASIGTIMGDRGRSGDSPHSIERRGRSSGRD